MLCSVNCACQVYWEDSAGSPQRQSGFPYPGFTLGINEAFGRALVELRVQRNLTQEQLSFRANVSRNYISLLEQGAYSPTVDMVMRLCIGLRVPLSCIITGTEQQLRLQNAAAELDASVAAWIESWGDETPHS